MLFCYVCSGLQLVGWGLTWRLVHADGPLAVLAAACVTLRAVASSEQWVGTGLLATVLLHLLHLLHSLC